MGLFDFLDDAKYQWNRFVAPVAFMAAGFYLLKLALVPELGQLNATETFDVIQNKSFFAASLLFIGGAVIWLLFLFDLINRIVGYGVMTLTLVVSTYVLYMDWKTIDEDVKYNAMYNEMEEEIKARINDVKYAEIAYKEFYGVYTADFDSLVYFVYNGFKQESDQSGALPERRISVEEMDMIYGDNRVIDNLMTDIEAHALAKLPSHASDVDGFRRDTVFLPILEAIFYTDKYLDTRSNFVDNLIAFHPDSMMHIPYSSLIATIDTGSVKKGDFTTPSLQIKMLHPLDSSLFQIGEIEISIGFISIGNAEKLKLRIIKLRELF